MLDTRRLLRIGLAKAKEQAAWLEGISIERSAGVPLNQLRVRVAVSRFELAREMKRQCTYNASAPTAMQRLTISRSYYAMYHAVRAAAYLHYGGDDHQQHSDLPQRIPPDLPNSAIWGNQLKSAREYRNQADYDPYPKSKNYWRSIAETVHSDSVALLPIVRLYLRNKGCSV